MSLIYVPQGKAREYSPFALNLYMGCTHKCKYCYVPRCCHKDEVQYWQKPEPRKAIYTMLDKELRENRPTKQVLFSFIGDPYTEATDNNEVTRYALETLLKYKVPVAILTKGGKRCLKHLELFKQFDEHIQVGATLTFDNDKDSYEWESGGASPAERLETLKILHDNGIKTFASFEPVIIPAQSLHLMEMGLDCIDTFKVGKLNNYKGLDKGIDWTDFLNNTVELLRANNKQFYIKHDLRLACPSVRLYGNEVLSDEHNVE